RDVPIPDYNTMLIKNFMEKLRSYLKAMSSRKLSEMPTFGLCALTEESATLCTWDSFAPLFIPLAQAMLIALPKLCDEMELICWECPCRIFTPVNLLDHLMDDNHVEMME
ncbi:hypothetical protein PENTCL1PPCAC_22140, partial [Pristionchus entomophagus]